MHHIYSIQSTFYLSSWSVNHESVWKSDTGHKLWVRTTDHMSLQLSHSISQECHFLASVWKPKGTLKFLEALIFPDFMVRTFKAT